MPDENVEIGVILTARVRADGNGNGGYDLTAEDGRVKIQKFGAMNTTPKVSLVDLKKAIAAIERTP